MSHDVTTFEQLIAHNDVRADQFRNHAIFSMLRDQTFADGAKRERLMAYIARFSSNFQTLLFLRQGLSADPRFNEVSARHLSAEIGHDALVRNNGSSVRVQDTIFEAILGWFNYQMIVLDNAEKTALMHLVLETGGDCFHTVAARSLGPHVDSPYFDIHAEADAAHARLGEDLLRDLGPPTYRRLATVVDQGWDMIDALIDRVRQRVAEE
jgi:hypothetical protein